MVRVLIVGGGVAGLSCAYYLRKIIGSQVNIVLAEKTDRFGGWIHNSVYTGASGKKYFFEHGPRSLISRGETLPFLSLLYDLGLEDDIIFADKKCKRRFVYKWGQINEVPTTVLGAFRSPLIRPLMFPILKNIMFGYKNHMTVNNLKDLSVGDFFRTRLSGAFVENIMEALVAGIWAGDVNKLSLSACFYNLPLYEAQSKSGSFLREMILRRGQVTIPYKPPFRRVDTNGTWDQETVNKVLKKLNANGDTFSFPNGLSTLCNTLLSKLENDERIAIRKLTSVKKISPISSGVNVELNCSSEHFDHVFWTAAAPSLGALLPRSNPATEILSKINYISVAVVHIAFASKEILDRNSGFGILLPSSEPLAQKGILGISFDSVIFPSHNQSLEETRITVMVGGTRCNISKLNQGDIENLSLLALRDMLGITKTPDLIKVNICSNAIAQPEIDHLEKIRFALSKLDPLHISLGGMVRGVSVPASVGTSAVLAGDFLRRRDITYNSTTNSEDYTYTNLKFN